MKRGSKIPENAGCVAIIEYNKTTKPSEVVRKAMSFSSLLKLTSPILLQNQNNI